MNRKGADMSNCLEYLNLHQTYVEALGRWSAASLIKDDRECNVAEKERDLGFRNLSLHTETCSQCAMKVTGQPKRASPGIEETILSLTTGRLSK
jgi:hypothetical protein